MALRVWALGFTSIAIGALATMALSFGLARGARQLRLALVCTCISAIFALGTQGPFALLVLWESTGLQLPDDLRLVFVPLGEALVGLLWLSVMILFEDARITPLRLAPTVLLMAISTGSLMIGMHATLGWAALGWLASLVNTVLAVHAFLCVAQGFRGDLVEKRRRLRRPLLLVLVLALTVVLTTQGAGFGSIITQTDITGIFAVLDVALAIMAVATAALFLEPRAVLLVELGPPAPREADDSADDAALAKLDALMTGDEVWRREGLTVGALAAEVGVPEHRLRVLINGRLGHRNFAAFINARRIEAARRQLADPAFADTPVSKIAYDLGFASLGPFNRAFKEATGQTPTEWRRTQQPALVS
jgi:AraC-like DNA-binding protein